MTSKELIKLLQKNGWKRASTGGSHIKFKKDKEKNLMVKVYPAMFHKEDEGGYSIDFPDVKGVYTCGDTVEEGISMASEALGMMLADYLENQKPFPPASSIDSLTCEDGFITYVSTDVEKYIQDKKAVKKMLSIPSWLAREAENHNLSLSKVLQEALMDKLNII